MYRPFYALLVLLEALAGSLLLVKSAHSQTLAAEVGGAARSVVVYAWPRDEEQIRRVELLEDAGRPGPREDRVAERAGHPVEDGRAREEEHLPRRQPRENLEPQVVGDESVVAGKAFRSPLRVRPSGQGECGQTKAGRPVNAK